MDLMGRADAALVAGDFATSATLERQRVALLEGLVGADSSDVAYARSSLALSLEFGGRLEEARAIRRSVVAILQREPTPRLGEELTSLGTIEIEIGDYASAIGTFQRAATLLKTFEADDPYGELATAQAGMGRGLVAIGKPREAIPQLEAALAWRERQTEIAPARLATPRWFLAQALWLGGGDKGRSRTLAEMAQADYERAVAELAGKPGVLEVAYKRSSALLADVRAWRATH